MNRNSVCCVIVTYNIGRKFLSCFNAVKDQAEKVVVVDNGSDQETLQVLKELQEGGAAEIIYNEDNMGIAFALNQGVKYAEKQGYAWVLTMDNDSKAAPFMVENMLKAYERLSPEDKLQVVSLFPKYLEEQLAESAEYKRLSENTSGFSSKYVDAEITSGNLVKTEVFSQVGYFEEKFFIDYVDIEFCLRLRSKGYKLLQTEAAVLFHNLGRSEVGRLLWRSFTYTNHSPLRRYYITRNRLYVWKKYINKLPRFVLNDIIFSFKDFFKVAAYEKNRGRKISMMFKGFCHALLGRCGKLST